MRNTLGRGQIQVGYDGKGAGDCSSVGTGGAVGDLAEVVGGMEWL